ncbi:MAG: hypothetical protein QOI80_1166, partial [Solirubrobacteraceae bacterium]|nr:hypothetical protein [Solirubrobacteraceae bacterium]
GLSGEGTLALHGPDGEDYGSAPVTLRPQSTTVTVTLTPAAVAALKAPTLVRVSVTIGESFASGYRMAFTTG